MCLAPITSHTVLASVSPSVTQVSKAFGCKGDAAKKGTGLIDFCQSDRQLQVSLSQKQETSFHFKNSPIRHANDCNFFTLFAEFTGEL